MKSIRAFLITCLLIFGARDASSLDLDNIEFVPDPSNPALTYTGVSDDFDATRVFDPSIVKVDDTYYMYYSGLRFGNQMQIGLATSLDGVNWTRSAANPVIRNTDQFWSGFRVFGPKVIYDTDEDPPLWKMWYGGNNQNLNARSSIGYATSPDGVNWTPNGSNPVFPPSPHIGLQVQGLIKESGQYRMYYASQDIDSLNLATSDDGLNWTPHPENPIRAGFSFRAVHKINANYVLFEKGFIGQSSDGLAFEFSDAPVLPTQEPISTGFVNPTGALVEGSDLHIWYTKVLGNVIWCCGNSEIHGAVANIQTGYTFTKIVDSDGPLVGLWSDPAISNDGKVAFFDFGLRRIVVGSGGESSIDDYITIAAESGPFTQTIGNPSINAAGAVAFGAFLDIGGRGIFTGFGEEVQLNDYTSIADTNNDPFTKVSIGSADINDVGTVVFRGEPSSGGAGIFTGNGVDPIIPIALTSGGPFSSLAGVFGHTSINGNGTVAFAADLNAGGSGIFTGKGGETNIYHYGTIANTEDHLSPFSGFTIFGGPILNDTGKVVFVAFLKEGGVGTFIGQAGDKKLSDYITVADTNGPFSAFFSSPSLNNAGTPAFHAILDTGGDGIFTGPDPVADKVIVDGDPLFGSTVIGQSFGRSGINDRGQLAFIAFLADGRTVIARADPVTSLEFPLRNKTPFTAVINTVFDHSMTESFCADGVVTAYTGEEGRSEFGVSFFSVAFKDCNNSRGNSPNDRDQLHGFKDAFGSLFSLGGQYTGGGEQDFLFYDGHPGYDYRTTDQLLDGTLCFGGTLCSDGRTEVLAAASGIVVCAKRRGCSEGPGAIVIDHANDYRTVYLHLSDIKVRGGDEVVAGEMIGTSGDVGSLGAPHLHFETRLRVDGIFVPVDPYGWTGIGLDPYMLAPNENLW